MIDKQKPEKNKNNLPSIKGTEGFIEKYYRWFLIGIIIITALVYSNAFMNDFTSFDDQDYVVDNVYLRDLSFQGIGNIFTSYYAANYHPITTLMWAAEYNVFGSGPLCFHLINILFHLFNTVLVFYFVKVLLKKERTALIVALLFAVHPMHVESVSWISERKDVLYAFFYLLSLIFYLRYLKNTSSLKNLVFAFFMFVFSLLSKSAAVTLPVLFFIIDYYRQRSFSEKMIFEKIPFLALSAALGIVAMLSQEVIINSAFTPQFLFSDRMFFASYAIGYYLLMSIFPFHFSALHYYPEKTGNMLPAEYYASVIIIIVLIILLIKAKKQRRLLFMGFGFFLVSVSVVLQLIPVGQAMVAERYTYIPYIGLFLIIAEMTLNAKPVFKKILLSVLAFLTVYYCFSTYQRNTVWKNSLTLFKDVYEKYPDAYYSSYALGNAYKEEGNAEKAIKYYSVSIDINPDYSDSYNNRGVLKNQIYDYSGAIDDLTKAIECGSPTSFTYFNRGMSYLNTSDFEKAVSDFDTSITMKDDLSDAYLFRGIAKCSKKSYDGAIEDFNTVISLDSASGMAYANRGTTEYYMNMKDSACADWNKAVNLGFSEANDMIKQFCVKK